MKPRLQTVLWMFALLASAMATFGVVGVAITSVILFIWAAVFGAIPISMAKRLFRITLLLLFIGGLISFLISIATWENVRDGIPGNSCRNNLQQIALAIHRYTATHKRLPSAYVVGKGGKPMHSWRVLILPYLDEQELYDAINLEEPWDSPNNRKLWDQMPEVYRCYGCKHACQVGAIQCPPNSPNYFAVVGPQTVWTESPKNKIRDTIDGTSNTIFLVESIKPAICWMEPKDLTLGDAVNILCSSMKPGHLGVDEVFFSTYTTSTGGFASLADAHNEFISSSISAEMASDLLTRNGKEQTEQGRFYGTANRQPPLMIRTYQWKRIYSFTMFVLLSLLPLTKFRG